MIFRAPVGEKKKRLKLSLNLRGTLARPSARFCTAAASASPGDAGRPAGLAVGSVGAWRAGRAEGVMRTERPGRAGACESPLKGALSASGSMADPGPGGVWLARRL